MLRVKIDLTQFEQELDILSKLLSRPAEFLADDLHDELTDIITDVFETDGHGEWPPRKDNLPHPLLRKTGRMFESIIKTQHPEHIWLVGGDTIILGTEVEYAEYHEGGTDRIPARPFFSILVRVDAETRLAQIAEQAIQRRL